MTNLVELKKKAEEQLQKKDLYLTSFMTTLNSVQENPSWILHFYNPLDDNLYSYDETSNKITGPQEVFKEENYIPELDVENIKFSYDTVIQKAQKEALPEKNFIKIVILLQTIDEKSVWNISFMNKSYQALNVRIDAISGVVLKKEVIELANFQN